MERNTARRIVFIRAINVGGAKLPMAQLRAALDAHPFDVVEDRFSYVYFLTAKPTAKAVKDFEAVERHDADVRVIGNDLHIRYLEGAGKSDLSAPKIAKALGVQGTGRNLNTVRTLIELAS